MVGIIDTMKLMGSLNLQGYSSCLVTNNSNYNMKKSIVPATKSMVVTTKSTKNNQFLCCSSSRFAVSEKLVSPEKVDNLNANTFVSLAKDFLSFEKKEDVSHLPDRICDFLSNLLFDEVRRETFTVTVVLLDEDGQLEEFRKLVDKARKERDLRKQANIILDEAVPFMIENADSWVSSRSMVVRTMMESCQKLDYSEEMSTDKVILSDNKRIDAPNTSHCFEVIIDLSVHGVFDDKFKGRIQTREDLIALLHHLRTIGSVMFASVFWQNVLVKKEKTKALEEYSHATY